MRATTFEVITGTERLAEVEPQWWALWRRAPDALPFQTPAWLIPWWWNFSPGALCTLAARREGQLVGLAPGYIEIGPLGRRILPLGISLSDHLDVLVDPTFAEEALAAMSAAASSQVGWDSWELEDLLPDASALRLPLPAGCMEETIEQTSCPVLHLPQGEGGALQLPLKKRRNIQLARNRCERRGAVRISQAQGPDALPALEQLFRLHEARWRSRGEAGVLSSEPVQAFQRQAVPLLQAAGLLRIYTLSLGAAEVAIYYVLSAGGRFCIYLSGFDPEFDFESPGVLLMAHIVEDAAAQGCREVDFLRGREAYKYGWGAVDRWNLKRSIRRNENV